MPTNLDLITERYREKRLSRKEAERDLIVLAGLFSADAHSYLNRIDSEDRATFAPPLPTATIPYHALPTSYFLEEEITACKCGEFQRHFRLYKEVRSASGVTTTAPMQKAEIIYDHTPIMHRQRHNGTPACVVCVGSVTLHHAPPPPPKPLACLAATHEKPKTSSFDLSDLDL